MCIKLLLTYALLYLLIYFILFLLPTRVSDAFENFHRE